MAKNNPLFVDSTKLRGDRIDTHIELGNILIYDGETVAVVVQNTRSDKVKVAMHQKNDVYRAIVWLGHQDAISYYFVVEKDNKNLFRSAQKSNSAQYAIIEKWEPCFDEPLEEQVAKKPLPVEDSATRTRQSASYARSLIEKWGF